MSALLEIAVTSLGVLGLIVLVAGGIVLECGWLVAGCGLGPNDPTNSPLPTTRKFRICRSIAAEGARDLVATPDTSADGRATSPVRSSDPQPSTTVHQPD